jgi:hypothetical protein
MDEVGITLEMMKNGNETYDEYYENSRESYVNFVNFAPTVRQLMQEVDY